MRKIFLSTDKNIPAPCSRTACLVSVQKFLFSHWQKQPIVSLRKNSSARSQKFKKLGPGGEKSFTGIQFCCQNRLFQPKIEEFWDPEKEKSSQGYNRKSPLHMAAAGLRKSSSVLPECRHDVTLPPRTLPPAPPRAVCNRCSAPSVPHGSRRPKCFRPA